jgi:hypothetical protein
MIPNADISVYFGCPWFPPLGEFQVGFLGRYMITYAYG